MAGMNKAQYLLKLRALLTASLLCLIVGAAFWERDAHSDDSIAKETIRILTVNLLFSEIIERDNRLRAIANWVSNNAVDVLLFQEVIEGPLALTSNSAEDLQSILSETYGLNYYLYTKTETAVPNLLNVGNSILSRHKIETQAVGRLSKATEEEIFGIYQFELVRNVVMIAFKMGDFPMIHVFNTHLCAGCESDEHEVQLDELLSFITNLESHDGDVNPVILGGDFNIDRINKGDVERLLYEKILSAGFVDAYAAAANEQLNFLCEDEDSPDLHCTIGASDLSDGKARRIDYIFIKGFHDVSESKVVFNSVLTDDPSVSDHSAVFTVLNMTTTKSPGTFLQLVLPLILED